MCQGFKRVSDSMEDLTLDVPHAAGDFAAICATAKAAGWLPANALVQVRPSIDPPKAILSELIELLVSPHCCKEAAQARSC